MVYNVFCPSHRRHHCLSSRPFVINLGEATGIASINGDDSSLSNTYDLQGRKVKTTGQSHKLRKGVYIVDGKKKVK